MAIDARDAWPPSRGAKSRHESRHESRYESRYESCYESRCESRYESRGRGGRLYNPSLQSL